MGNVLEVFCSVLFGNVQLHCRSATKLNSEEASQCKAWVHEFYMPNF